MRNIMGEELRLMESSATLGKEIMKTLKDPAITEEERKKIKKLARNFNKYLASVNDWDNRFEDLLSNPEYWKDGEPPLSKLSV